MYPYKLFSCEVYTYTDRGLAYNMMSYVQRTVKGLHTLPAGCKSWLQVWQVWQSCRGWYSAEYIWGPAGLQHPTPPQANKLPSGPYDSSLHLGSQPHRHRGAGRSCMLHRPLICYSIIKCVMGDFISLFKRSETYYFIFFIIYYFIYIR